MEIVLVLWLEVVHHLESKKQPPPQATEEPVYPAMEEPDNIIVERKGS